MLGPGQPSAAKNEMVPRNALRLPLPDDSLQTNSAEGAGFHKLCNWPRFSLSLRGLPRVFGARSGDRKRRAGLRQRPAAPHLCSHGCAPRFVCPDKAGPGAAFRELSDPGENALPDRFVTPPPSREHLAGRALRLCPACGMSRPMSRAAGQKHHDAIPSQMQTCSSSVKPPFSAASSGDIRSANSLSGLRLRCEFSHNGHSLLSQVRI